MLIEIQFPLEFKNKTVMAHEHTIRECSSTLFVKLQHPTSHDLVWGDLFYPARTVRVVSIYMYVYLYVCLWGKKYLNRTLAIDSLFQTIVVGLLVEFID